ncbi:hypothetical protein D3C81_2253420 [compost metagenome]
MTVGFKMNSGEIAFILAMSLSQSLLMKKAANRAMIMMVARPGRLVSRATMLSRITFTI